MTANPAVGRLTGRGPRPRPAGTSRPSSCSSCSTGSRRRSGPCGPGPDRGSESATLAISLPLTTARSSAPVAITSIRLRWLTLLIAPLLPAAGKPPPGGPAIELEALALGEDPHRVAAASAAGPDGDLEEGAPPNRLRGRLQDLAVDRDALVGQLVVALHRGTERAGGRAALDRGEHHLALLPVLLVAALAAARAHDLAELALGREVVEVHDHLADRVRGEQHRPRRERGEHGAGDGFPGDHWLGQRSRCTPLNTLTAQEDRARNFTPRAGQGAGAVGYRTNRRARRRRDERRAAHRPRRAAPPLASVDRSRAPRGGPGPPKTSARLAPR